jgi:hypothetical protein
VVAFIYGTKLVSERKSLEAMNAEELNIERKKERKKKLSSSSIQ